jgi:hypothetical protein
LLLTQQRFLSQTAQILDDVVLIIMVVMVGYFGLLLSGIVFAAAGRIVLGCFPGNHATKNNLLVVLVFSFVGAGMFFVLVFLIARVLNISLNARDENTLTYISWMIGGLIGGAIAAWRMTRPRPPRKVISKQ